jgi:hypothetical protein
VFVCFFGSFTIFLHRLQTPCQAFDLLHQVPHANGQIDKTLFCVNLVIFLELQLKYQHRFSGRQLVGFVKHHQNGKLVG